MKDDQANGRDEAENEQVGVQAQDASASEKKSEVSIYVVKTTVAGTDGSAETVTFGVGVNGHTHLVAGDRAAALEKIGAILDGME